MADSKQTKKLIITGVAIAILAGGGYGYYSYSHKQAAPAASHEGHGSAAAVPASTTGDKVVLDAKARQLAGVQTAVVAAKNVVKEIRTTGKIAINDTGRAYITSRVMGRIDELYINAEGEYIAPGQAIAAVYSPDYIAAQEEYLLAMDTVYKLRNASKDIVQINNRLLDASRRKLELLGVPAGDIEHLTHTRKASTHMIIRAQFGGTVLEKPVLPGAYIMAAGEKLFAVSDLSTVWLYVDLYEKDIAVLQVGQEVAVTTPAYPGETFTGRVSFINPILDDTTRTVKVRVELANPAGKLKPNMFASAAVKVPLGESLVIPASGLLDTGKRKVVFVAEGEDTFVKRDIVTGQETQGLIQVLSGLKAGDTVVTAATFLIDSQTQLGAYGSRAGHGGSKQSATPPAAASQSSIPVPQAPVQSAPPANAGGGHSGH